MCAIYSRAVQVLISCVCWPAINFACRIRHQTRRLTRHNRLLIYTPLAKEQGQ